MPVVCLCILSGTLRAVPNIWRCRNHVWWTRVICMICLLLYCRIPSRFLYLTDSSLTETRIWEDRQKEIGRAKRAHDKEERSQSKYLQLSIIGERIDFENIEQECEKGCNPLQEIPLLLLLFVALGTKSRSLRRRAKWQDGSLETTGLPVVFLFRTTNSRKWTCPFLRRP